MGVATDEYESFSNRKYFAYSWSERFKAWIKTRPHSPIMIYLKSSIIDRSYCQLPITFYGMKSIIPSFISRISKNSQNTYNLNYIALEL